MPLARKPIPLGSFAPDRDIITPGILIDGNDMYPTPRGLRTLPQLYPVTEPLPGPCLGACVVTFPDDVQVVIAGTAEYLNTALVLSMMPNGGTMWGSQHFGPTNPPVSRWRFAFYDGMVFAADGVRKPVYATQASLTLTPSNAWTEVPDSPYAALVESSDYSLFMVGEATAPSESFLAAGNRWWSSVNPFIWLSGSVPVGSVNARISQTPGPITALKALRSQMVLYKERSIFLAQLVGPPLIWNLSEVSRQVGAVNQECVVSVEDVHYFLGNDDWYRLDGFSVTRLPNEHRNWFFERVAPFSLSRVVGRYDEQRSLIFWHFNSSSDPRNEWVCLDVRSGNWTKGSRAVQMGIAGIGVPTVNTQELGATTGLFLSDVLYLYGPTGDGASAGAFATTGAIGDRHSMYQLSRVRPGYNILNGTPRLTLLSSYSPGAAFVPNTPTNLSADGWFNVLNTARLQCLKFESDEDVAIADYEVQINPVGDV